MSWLVHDCYLVADKLVKSMQNHLLFETLYHMLSHLCFIENNIENDIEVNVYTLQTYFIHDIAKQPQEN